MATMIGFFLSMVILDNVILMHFVGVRPFINITKKQSAVGTGIVVIAVILLSTIVSYVLYNYVLVPIEMEYLNLVTFALVIGCMVVLVSSCLKKYKPNLSEEIRVHVQLVVSNCAVLYVLLGNASNNYGFVQSVVNGLGVAVGFLLIVYIFTMIRERLESSDTLKSLKGSPITLITAGIMALALNGLAGIL